MQRFASMAAVVAALVTGCGVSFMSDVSQVRDPLTPEAAKAQAITTARSLKSVLGFPATGGWVYLSSCNDQGEAPFRGAAAIHYPLARSREDALAETAAFLQTLEKAGWTVLPPEYKGSQSLAAEKDGVRVIFEVQSGGDDGRVISVLGECRDITSKKGSLGGMDPIPGLSDK